MKQVLLPLTVSVVFVLSSMSVGQSTQPTRDEASARLLESVGQAYSSAKSLNLVGTISLDVDAAGRQQKQSAQFTTSFAAPAKFRHEVKDWILVVASGEKTLIYDPRANQYAEAAALADRVPCSKLPAPLPMLLLEQNPALLLALCTDATSTLVPADSDLSIGDDVKLGEATFQSLTFRRDGRLVRLLVDPATKLLRQVRIDASDSLRDGGVPDVKRAELVIDYSTTTINGELPADALAWTPPKDARLMARDNPAELVETERHPLVGKPAPDFTLERLEGGEVKLSDLKGKVVVLDFWATWCPPCREGLPHLAKLHDAKKDAGLELFAINVREAKPQVQQFLQEQKLSLPVLMDANGKVSGLYMVRGIPQTVVIGKDGNVREVFVGFAPPMAAQIDQAVAEAMKP